MLGIVTVFTLGASHVLSGCVVTVLTLLVQLQLRSMVCFAVFVAVRGLASSLLVPLALYRLCTALLSHFLSPRLLTFRYLAASYYILDARLQNVQAVLHGEAPFVG